MRGLVGDRESRVDELAARRIDHECGGQAAPAEPEHLLVVHVAARAHAELALDAAIAVDDRVGMRSVDVESG